MSVSHVDMQLACRTKALSLTTTLSTAFSRASTATYTDVNGIVQTAAINVARNADYSTGLSAALRESAATNLLLYSEQIDNAAWTKGRASVSANAVVAPDGNTTADKLVEDATVTSTHFAAQSATLTSASASYTKSCYAKPAGRNWILFQVKDLAGAFKQANFNISTGAVGTVSSGATATISAVGNSWYRCTMTFNSATGANSPNEAIFLSSGDGGSTYSGDGASGAYIWGAQTELGALATSYIPTTTLAVTRAADLGAVFAATAQGYTRDSGSFVTDGFEIGTEITPSGFAVNLPDTVTAVSALSITTRSPHAVEAGQLGRNFSIGLPSDFAWENLRFTPTQGIPYVREEYLPGPMSLNSMGTSGNITVEPTYRLTVFVPQNSGISADGQYADAIMNLFAPSTEMLLPDGNVLFVRADVAPIRGQRLQSQGLSGIPVTIPLRAYISNSDTTNPFYVVFTDSDGDIAIESSIAAALAEYQLVIIDSDGDPLAP